MGKSRQAAVVGALLEQDMLRQREASLTAAADIVAEQRGLQLIASVVNRQNTAAADATLWRRVVEVRRQLSSGIHERRHKLKALLKLEYDQTLAENEIQIALKSRRQHQEAKDEKVFEAIWTEALNKKILRERSAVTMRQKRAEELRAALREQIASRQDNRLKEMERLKIENQEEAYRLKAEAESAVELRRQQHTAALQRRREMDAILILQLEQKHRRRMEEAALDRCQLETQTMIRPDAEGHAQFFREDGLHPLPGYFSVEKMPIPASRDAPPKGYDCTVAGTECTLATDCRDTIPSYGK
ncbi:hypothetical protein cyc_05032 [Cyclospora cayetanensis]|uniref:Trichohyalin-plectin-homology domain-containing protein n=1 Tax=Cyclospora cayetanensis TaxID=88456 RepID=A0A1D3CXB3_9EIME|nr:hypothetical protein cyc_05032 [Cyclospora cayetanensis]